MGCIVNELPRRQWREIQPKRQNLHIIAMNRAPFYLLLTMIFVSCNILNSENEEKLSIELNPEHVQIGEKPTIIIKNFTDSAIRYHYGHNVEVFKNGEWEAYTTIFCANCFPLSIEPNDSHSIPISLFAEETGTYRVVIHTSEKDRDEWVLKQRTTNSIEITQ